MKKIVLLYSILYIFSACNDTQKKTQESVSGEAVKTTQETAQINNNISTEQDGYTLMKQFCFSCHMEKPDSSKHNQMIAPPMVNVQEHYKSTYPDEDEFIQAVVSWVNKPDESKVLMPGAARKFNLMPPLPIGDDKLKAIAKALYKNDFGEKLNGHKKGNHKMMGGKLQLNKGEKWKLAGGDMNKIRQIQKKLQQSNLKDIQAYQQLGKEVFKTARSILLNKNYKAKTLQQIQTFFHNIEEDMHNLMAVKTVEDGKKYQNILLKKFMEFNHYFE